MTRIAFSALHTLDFSKASKTERAKIFAEAEKFQTAYGNPLKPGLRTYDKSKYFVGNRNSTTGRITVAIDYREPNAERLDQNIGRVLKMIQGTHGLAKDAYSMFDNNFYGKRYASIKKNDSDVKGFFAIPVAKGLKYFDSKLGKSTLDGVEIYSKDGQFQKVIHFQVQEKLDNQTSNLTEARTVAPSQANIDQLVAQLTKHSPQIAPFAKTLLYEMNKWGGLFSEYKGTSEYDPRKHVATIDANTGRVKVTNKTSPNTAPDSDTVALWGSDEATYSGRPPKRSVSGPPSMAGAGGGIDFDQVLREAGFIKDPAAAPKTVKIPLQPATKAPTSPTTETFRRATTNSGTGKSATNAPNIPASGSIQPAKKGWGIGRLLTFWK